MSAAQKLIEFINKAPSPFHVVEQCRRKLLSSGFTELKENSEWKELLPDRMGKYFVTRNQSCIIAFAIGGKYDHGNGFAVIGAHTDSPCLKVKPVSKRSSNGYISVGVECYGGGIWNTWFDRDLTIAGRAVVKNGSQIMQRLVHIQRPILRIPHLAIHLQRDINDSFSPNKEKHILPVLATSSAHILNGDPSDGNGPNKTEESTGSKQRIGKHSSLLTDAICKEIDCEPQNLVDLELCLADTQPAALGGISNEFIFAPRLDNLFNVYSSVEALIQSLDNDSLLNDTCIRMVACYDNEEVGSVSNQGAASKMTESVMLRILKALGKADSFEQSLANSFLVSADQSHAVHPNYVEKHEECHRPSIQGGPVLKFNCNQRYATSAITAGILRIIAEKVNIELQDYVVRNDSPCGSTIGPILSSKLGIRTVDIGGPMLSMHSIREMCCAYSVDQTVSLYKAFFEDFSAIDAAFDSQ